MKNLIFALLLFALLFTVFFFIIYNTSEKGKILLEDFSNRNSSKINYRFTDITNTTEKSKKNIKQHQRTIVIPNTYLYAKPDIKSQKTTTLFLGDIVLIDKNFKNKFFYKCKTIHTNGYIKKDTVEFFKTITEQQRFLRTIKRQGYINKLQCIKTVVRALKRKNRYSLLKCIHKNLKIYYLNIKRKVILTKEDIKNLSLQTAFMRKFYGEPYNLHLIFKKASKIKYSRNINSETSLYPEKGNFQIKFSKIGNRWFCDSLIIGEETYLD